MKRIALNLLAFFALLQIFSVAAPAPAYAYYCCACCYCCDTSSTKTIVKDDFDEYRDTWIVDTEFFQSVEKEFKHWADRLRTVPIIRATTIGGLYDAQAHSATMLTLQKLTAEAMSDYTPSQAVCQYGTIARSLAASEAKGRANQILLSEMGLSRQLGIPGNLGAAGRGLDRSLRTDHFIGNFCQTTDDDNALLYTCAGSTEASMLNRDIDYVRTMSVPATLNVDLTDFAAPTNREMALAELGNNLYGSSLLLKRLSSGQVNSDQGLFAYNLIRSVIAKRSVAQNSFAAIAGMKSEGSGAADVWAGTVLKNLNMSPTSKDEKGKMSYYALMDMLTKRLYQDPAFYANLYEAPANINRQTAAMEGLELIQDRDIYHTMTRSEMLLALLVELESVKLQSKMENRMTTGQD